MTGIPPPAFPIPPLPPPTLPVPVPPGILPLPPPLPLGLPIGFNHPIPINSMSTNTNANSSVYNPTCTSTTGPAAAKQYLFTTQAKVSTILLTNIPTFLQYPRNLRDFILATYGNCKLIFYSCDIKRSSAFTPLCHVTSSTCQPPLHNVAVVNLALTSNTATQLLLHGHNNHNGHNGYLHGHQNHALYNVVSFVKDLNLAFEYIKHHPKLDQNEHESQIQEHKQDEELPKFDMKAFALALSNYSSSSTFPSSTTTSTVPNNMSMSNGVIDSASNPMDVPTMESIWEVLYNETDTTTTPTKPENYDTNGMESTSTQQQQQQQTIIRTIVDAYRNIQLRQSNLDKGIGILPISDLNADSDNMLQVDGNYNHVPTNTSSLLATQSQSDNLPKTSNNVTNTTTTTTTTQTSTLNKKLDVTRLAAAAGGQYDEETDPLNAPAVLEAVAAFKQKLIEKETTTKQKRCEFVDKRLLVELNKAKKNLLEQRQKQKEREQQQQQQQQEEEEEERDRQRLHQQQLEHPNHLPPLPPPGLPPTQLPDTGKRGVSNLPAWMTASNTNPNDDNNNTNTKKRSASELNNDDDNNNQENEQHPNKQRKFVISEVNRDVNARKQRLDVSSSSFGLGDGQSLAEIRAANQAADAAMVLSSSSSNHNTTVPDTNNNNNNMVYPTTKDEILFGDGSYFPLLTPALHDSIRLYIKDQIIEYIGEEENTLIDFIVKHLQNVNAQERTTKALFDELFLVLEEDAETFVVNLFRKVVGEER